MFILRPHGHIPELTLRLRLEHAVTQYVTIFALMVITDY
jgi:hypothetical protein